MKWWKRWKGRRPANQPSQDRYTIQDISLQQFRTALQQYEEQLTEGLNRTLLLQADNRIDHVPLLPFLQAIPSRSFYMSRETFEIFPEEEQHIAKYLDQVQQAVDSYINEHRKWPTVTPHSLKINTHVLVQQRYLQEAPPMDFYMTNQESMVTHRRPD